jgi:hypothetical protein
MSGLRFRFAERKDTALYFVLSGVAEYENCWRGKRDGRTAVEWIFDKKKAEVLFAVRDGAEVASPLFTISPRPGEAALPEGPLRVRPVRGKGYGKALLRLLAKLPSSAGAEGWSGRASTGISEHRLLSVPGARPMEEWTTYRQSGEPCKCWPPGTELHPSAACGDGSPR